MSVQKMVTMMCDECLMYAEESFPTAREARSSAKRQGWNRTIAHGTTDNRVDLCTTCWRKYQRKAAMAAVIDNFYRRSGL